MREQTTTTQELARNAATAGAMIAVIVVATMIFMWVM